ncbi:MAG TPA: hypothetical protein VG938_07675 [Verrucomicrobiae bacterium]|jgi:hypothetical protein|nr:hypothetical protein [Verrucomicrobiae bacterium]
MTRNSKSRATRQSGALKGGGLTRKNIRPQADKPGLRCLTNHFEDVQLASLASWREVNEIFRWDRGGPYIVTQAGYDPDDLTMTPDEFVFGRSGKWLALGVFFRLSRAERWQGFVFSTAGEVLRVMGDLPAKAVTWLPTPAIMDAIVSTDTDEMVAAYRFSRQAPCRTAG